MLPVEIGICRIKIKIILSLFKNDNFRILEKLKVLSSGGSMNASLKLKGIDGKAPQGVELAA